jgi:hypothetical protein
LRSLDGELVTKFGVDTDIKSLLVGPKPYDFILTEQEDIQKEKVLTDLLDIR